jgi:periplasmic protein TonB
MTAREKQTLDDMVFENRNREYGSYDLRRKFYSRIAIGFSVSLAFVLLITLGYFWYLNKAGDENVYFGSEYMFSQETNVSLLSPEELQGYAQNKQLPETPDISKAANEPDPMHNFRVTENARVDTFKQQEEEEENNSEQHEPGFGMINDSTVFGGFLEGNGEGMGGIVDRLPVFMAGSPTEYVERNVRYPTAAMKKKIYGIVHLSFVVTKTGHVSEVQVIRGINPLIDAEAVKVIREMPAWKPAMRHGKPINFMFTIRVNFVPLS